MNSFETIWPLLAILLGVLIFPGSALFLLRKRQTQLAVREEKLWLKYEAATKPDEQKELRSAVRDCAETGTKAVRVMVSASTLAFLLGMEAVIFWALATFHVSLGDAFWVLAAGAAGNLMLIGCALFAFLRRE